MVLPQFLYQSECQFYGSILSCSQCGKFPREQVAQRTVGSLRIVIASPGFHPLRRALQGQEPVLVQTLLTEPSSERLDEGVVRRFPGPDEVQLDSVQVRPLVQTLGGELRAVVHPDGLG